MRDGGLGPGLGHFWESQSYREIPSCWSSLTKLWSKGSSILLLPFEPLYRSPRIRQRIMRYDCDSQKCPRPGPKPPSRIHYSNQYHAISSQYYTQPLGDYESWRLEVCCLLFLGTLEIWFSHNPGTKVMHGRYLLDLSNNPKFLRSNLFLEPKK